MKLAAMEPNTEYTALNELIVAIKKCSEQGFFNDAVLVIKKGIFSIYLPEIGDSVIADSLENLANNFSKEVVPNWLPNMVAIRENKKYEKKLKELVESEKIQIIGFNSEDAKMYHNIEINDGECLLCLYKDGLLIFTSLNPKEFNDYVKSYVNATYSI